MDLAHIFNHSQELKVQCELQPFILCSIDRIVIARMFSDEIRPFL